ncbi:cyclophilin-like fold protein [Aureimonas sp. AU22]|uniref:cyclophilin-like fold protein n=1 Tax=Aureimonas sp. AU22 TaxID=1638162 RepID=UPI0007813FFD|nr:cyclophilin-like fold protein [Aureimonas sp. AU22]
MLRFALTLTVSMATMDYAIAQDRITISSDWGTVDAVLTDNEAASALLDLLPITLDMRDHLRQEKTGKLPISLPRSERRLDFSPGTIGLWGSNDFVVYYREGEVPWPGIVVLGHAEGDVAIFDRPGRVSVRIERSER